MSYVIRHMPTSIQRVERQSGVRCREAEIRYISCHMSTSIYRVESCREAERGCLLVISLETSTPQRIRVCVCQLVSVSVKERQTASP